MWYVTRCNINGIDHVNVTFFNVQCTKNFGGIDIGRNIWTLGVEVTKKNMTTNLTLNTRICVGLLPDEICGANELKFSLDMDTQTGDTSVTPITTTIYQSLIYDNIGLFKNSAWIIDPIVNFSVSQVGLDKPQTRVDLTTPILGSAPILPALAITIQITLPLRF